MVETVEEDTGVGAGVGVGVGAGTEMSVEEVEEKSVLLTFVDKAGAWMGYTNWAAWT